MAGGLVGVSGPSTDWGESVACWANAAMGNRAMLRARRARGIRVFRRDIGVWVRRRGQPSIAAILDDSR